MTAGQGADWRICVRVPRQTFDVEVDLSLPASGVTVLFGPSGSGKTSVLRAVAGLEAHSHGVVRVGDELWQDDAAGVRRPTWQRAVGYVFQEASLFEHLDVRGNLRFGLQRSREAGGEAVLAEAVDLLGIGDLLDRRSAELSGGERQRVAIARALAAQPRVLLLDEPLAALDLARRREVLPWLERLHERARIPLLYVTHATDELTRLADHLVVMERGRVRASGPVDQVLSGLEAPELFGDEAGALLQAQVVERDVRWQLARVQAQGLSLWLSDGGWPVGATLRLRVLARDVSVATQAPSHSSIQNVLPAQVDCIVDDAQPSQALVRLRCGQGWLLARLTRRAVATLALQPGMAVWAQVKSVALVR